MKMISQDKTLHLLLILFIFQNLSDASEAEARFCQQTVSNCYKLTAVRACLYQMKYFTDLCKSGIGLMGVKLSSTHKKSLIWAFKCWSSVHPSYFLWSVSTDFVLQVSLSPSPSLLTTLKTSVKKELWVSVIHYRNFSGCKGDRWDTNTDSINKINPSATINCICACLLSWGFSHLSKLMEAHQDNATQVWGYIY